MKNNSLLDNDKTAITIKGDTERMKERERERVRKEREKKKIKRRYEEQNLRGYVEKKRKKLSENINIRYDHARL